MLKAKQRLFVARVWPDIELKNCLDFHILTWEHSTSISTTVIVQLSEMDVAQVLTYRLILSVRSRLPVLWACIRLCVNLAQSCLSAILLLSCGCVREILQIPSTQSPRLHSYIEQMFSTKGHECLIICVIDAVFLFVWMCVCVCVYLRACVRARTHTSVSVCSVWFWMAFVDKRKEG